MPSGRQSPAHWKCTLVHLLCARRSGRKDDEHELVPVPRGSQGSERRPGLALLQRSFSLGQSGRCGAGRSGNLRKPRQRGDELQPCIRTGIMATAQTVQCGRPGFSPWVGKISWRRKWQPAPVLLPREAHGQRSQVGYSPWGRKEWDMTE